MKVEGETAATSTFLHKVKVKEEAKEYFGYQQSSESSSSTTAPTAATTTTTAIAATTTMTTTTTTTTTTITTTTTTTTTTSTKTTTATTTTTTSTTTATGTPTTSKSTTSASAGTVASVVTAPGSSTIVASIVNSTNGGVSSVAATPPTITTVPNALSPAATATLHQPSGLVCHLSAPASSVLVNADPFPVDLDLKTKIKGASLLYLFVRATYSLSRIREPGLCHPVHASSCMRGVRKTENFRYTMLESGSGVISVHELFSDFAKTSWRTFAWGRISLDTNCSQIIGT